MRPGCQRPGLLETRLLLDGHQNRKVVTSTSMVDKRSLRNLEEELVKEKAASAGQMGPVVKWVQWSNFWWNFKLQVIGV